MAESVEAVREMGRVLMESMNQQLEAQRRYNEQREQETRQYNREREEATLQQFRLMVDGQTRHNREGTDILAEEFQQMRLERQQSRGMTVQRLPNFDGTNLEIDDWEEKAIAVMTYTSGHLRDFSRQCQLALATEPKGPLTL